MIEAIKYNLANLTNFSGRDARPTFWWYVLFLVVAQFVVGFLAAIPMVVSSGVTAFDAVQSGGNQEQIETMMFAGMAEAMETQIYISAALSIAVMLLLVASFVRRLHDGGFSGFLAAIPFGLQVVAITGSISMIGKMQEMFAVASDPVQLQQMQADLAFTWGSVAGWLAFLVIVGFGVMKSQNGPNRYGEEPEALGR